MARKHFHVPLDDGPSEASSHVVMFEVLPRYRGESSRLRFQVFGPRPERRADERGAYRRTVATGAVDAGGALVLDAGAYLPDALWVRVSQAAQQGARELCA